MSLFNFVKSKLFILDVVSDYLQLKHAGNYFKGPCPFHYEKEASFTVSPDRQIFYCFGCQAGGDVIAFVAKVENMSQLEAVKFLIEKYQIEVPKDLLQGAFKSNNKIGHNNTYYEICRVVADWANEQLLANNIAKNYLSERAIDLDLVKYFKIGYFAGGVRSINNFIKKMSTKGILVKDLIEAGILMEGRSILYSPFEERIVFPIKDVIGRYCGFGGRVFKSQDKRAKYYNSKENACFLKGKLLFGLDLAKKEMQKKSNAFLVEGYTDCVAMVKHGFRNTVATLGTSCTQEHLKTLSRYVKTLYVLYDGDDAGQKAILRLTNLCWNVNLELLIVKLPKKEDPASFLNREGDLNSLIEQASDIFSFFVESVGREFVGGSLAQKLACSKEILQIVSTQDSFKQELLLQQAASVMQVPFSMLKKQMRACSAKIIFNGKSRASDQKEKSIEDGNTKSEEKSVPLLEERIFSAIINSINKAERLFIEPGLVPYFSEYIQFLLQKLEVCNKEGGFSSCKCFDILLSSLDESDKNWVIRCSLKFDPVVSKDLFEQLIFHFCKQNWKNIVQDMKLRLQKAKQQGDDKKLEELFVLFSKLKNGIQDRGLI
jgi:DNA primase